MSNSITLNQTASAEVAELRAQLAAAVAARDGAIAAQKSSLGRTVELTNDCLFLKKLPIEIRNEIYKLLLVNPVLATPAVLESWYLYDLHHTQIHKYRLSPSLLRTCHQIHQEASAILYGQNTFIVNCTNASHIQSPILRYPCSGHSDNYFRPSEKLLDLEIVKRVRSWRVAIVGWDTQSMDAHHTLFTTFCRAICLHPPQSLEVILMPQKTRNNRFGDYYFRDGLLSHKSYTEDDMYLLLRPLALLRNIKHVHFNPGNRSLGRFTPVPIKASLVSNMRSLIEGSSPPMHFFRMYEHLLRYAQSFERIDIFKAQMSRSYIEQGAAVYKSDASDDSQSEHADEAEVMRSPYQLHPVERALSKANENSSGFSPDRFFKARDQVLSYLEPQFQRIATAGRDMAETVKLLKNRGGFLDPAGYEDHGCNLEDLAKGLACLEAYAKSFNRDIPESLQPKFRILKRDLDLLYRNMPRECLLNRLDNWIQRFRNVKYIRSQVELDEFATWFREAVDDMEVQHSQIQLTRKTLLDSDFDSTGCSIDLDLYKTNERIDWTICEPDIHLPSIQRKLAFERGFLGNCDSARLRAEAKAEAKELYGYSSDSSSN